MGRDSSWSLATARVFRKNCTLVFASVRDVIVLPHIFTWKGTDVAISAVNVGFKVLITSALGTSIEKFKKHSEGDVSHVF